MFYERTLKAYTLEVIHWRRKQIQNQNNKSQKNKNKQELTDRKKIPCFPDDNEGLHSLKLSLQSNKANTFRKR